VVKHTFLSDLFFLDFVSKISEIIQEVTNTKELKTWLMMQYQYLKLNIPFELSGIIPDSQPSTTSMEIQEEEDSDDHSSAYPKTQKTPSPKTKKIPASEAQKAKKNTKPTTAKGKSQQSPAPVKSKQKISGEQEPSHKRRKVIREESSSSEESEPSLHEEDDPASHESHESSSD